MYNWLQSDLFKYVNNPYTPENHSFLDVYTTSDKEARSFIVKLHSEYNCFSKIVIGGGERKKGLINKKIEIKKDFFFKFLEKIEILINGNSDQTTFVNGNYGEYLKMEKANGIITLVQKYAEGNSNDEVKIEIPSFEVNMIHEAVLNSLKIVNFMEKSHTDCIKTLQKARDYLKDNSHSIVDQTREKYMAVLHFYHEREEQENSISKNKLPITVCMKNFIEAHANYPWSLNFTPTFVM